MVTSCSYMGSIIHETAKRMTEQAKVRAGTDYRNSKLLYERQNESKEKRLDCGPDVIWPCRRRKGPTGMDPRGTKENGFGHRQRVSRARHVGYSVQLPNSNALQDSEG